MPFALCPCVKLDHLITLSALASTFGGIADDFGFSISGSADYFIGSS
jgi:hypothetical protein